MKKDSVSADLYKQVLDILEGDTSHIAGNLARLDPEMLVAAHRYELVRETETANKVTDAILEETRSVLWSSDNKTVSGEPNKVVAIKYYRQNMRDRTNTNISLRDARDLVTVLVAQGPK